VKNYILNLKLLDTDLSRTISIPEKLEFYDLHRIIQTIFGWENNHLHEFTVNNMRIVSPENEDVFEMYGDDFKFEDDVNLDFILSNVKTFKYTYDFGDNWEIKITVQKIIEKKVEYPKLIMYNGTMAKEDCGGADGLMEQGGDEVNLDEINAILEEAFLN
jgi:hypothetical protein